MIYPTRTIELSPRDNDHCKRLKDLSATNLYHLEAYLPFTEAVKLEKVNANIRPPSERKKPFEDMLTTLGNDPASFHRKNREITYLCDKFEYDNAKRRLLVVGCFNNDMRNFKELRGMRRKCKSLKRSKEGTQRNSYCSLRASSLSRNF